MFVMLPLCDKHHLQRLMQDTHYNIWHLSLSINLPNHAGNPCHCIFTQGFSKGKTLIYVLLLKVLALHCVVTSLVTSLISSSSSSVFCNFFCYLVFMILITVLNSIFHISDVYIT